MRRQREKVEEKTYSLHTMTKRNSIIIGLCVAILATSAVLFTPRASAQVTGSINSQLEIGMSGPAVTQLQTFLAMDSSIYPEGLVTGYFGSLTRAAVLRFQARYGIDQVGRVGPQTLARINAFIASGGFGGVELSVDPDKAAPGRKLRSGWAPNEAGGAPKGAALKGLAAGSAACRL
jgi:hypothetical protein